MKIDKFIDFVNSKYPNIIILNSNDEIKFRDKVNFYM